MAGYYEESSTATHSSTTSSDYVWISWVGGSTSVCSGTTYTVTWSQWNSGYTIEDSLAWEHWVKDDPTDSSIIQYSINPPVALTKEEIRAREDRWREERERAEKLRKEKEEAENKAKQLLLDLIGKDQLKIYEETGRLFVKGRKFDYIVQREGFVKKIEKNRVVDLCVHLQDRYKFPETDNVVALKLAIESEEDMILKMANDHGSIRLPKKLPRAACMRA